MDDVEIIDLEAETAGSSSVNGDCTTKKVSSNGYQLQTSRQRPSLQDKIKSLNRRVIRYDFLISDMNSKIQELGERDISMDDLNCDQNLYTKIAKLQENVLKARIARNKLNSIIKSLQCKRTDQTRDDRESSCRPVEKIVRFSGSGYEPIDQAITRHINRYKSLSSSSPCYDLSNKFYNIPSFHDVLKIVRRQNDHQKLGLNVSEVYSLSQSTGNKVLLQLKKYTVAERKQFIEDWAQSSHGADPAVDSKELESKLVENKQIASTESKKLITHSDLTDLETSSIQSWLKSESTEQNSCLDQSVSDENDQKVLKAEPIITIAETEDHVSGLQTSADAPVQKSKTNSIEVIDLSIDD